MNLKQFLASNTLLQQNCTVDDKVTSLVFKWIQFSICFQLKQLELL